MATMNNDILLTVLIPTYNRAELLRHTLSMMEDQLRRNSTFVKLVVCDNVSTDHTSDVISEMRLQGFEIEYIQYREHVPVGMSITRSVENVKSKYFLLWSDDDFPAPMMLDLIVDTLLKYPEISALSFNRINALSSTNIPTALYDLRVFTPRFSKYLHYYESSQKYAEERFSEVDFVSINVVSLQAWKKGMEIYSEDHLGFQFLAPILYGIQGYPCVYIEYPLCIKRNPPIEEISYAKYWPLYAYVGKPRILKDLQKVGAISDAGEVFKRDAYNNREEYIANLIGLCYPNKSIYAPYVEEMVSYQRGKIRIFMTKVILWPNFSQKIVACVYKLLLKFNII